MFVCAKDGVHKYRGVGEGIDVMNRRNKVSMLMNWELGMEEKGGERGESLGEAGGDKVHTV